MQMDAVRCTALLALLALASCACAAIDHPNEGVSLADFVASKLGGGGAAKVQVASADTYKHRKEACFQETTRCLGATGNLFSIVDLDGLVVGAAGQYVSSFTCCSEPHHAYEREGANTVFAPLSSSFAGYCVIDYKSIAPFSTAPSGVLVGSGSAACSIADADECGAEGCSGATVGTTQLQSVLVQRAVSFTGDGRPPLCPKFFNLPRAAADAAAHADNATRRGGDARRQAGSGAAAGPVCVGPAVLLSGPVLVGSRNGPQRAGWLTYETFAYDFNGLTSVLSSGVDCTTVPADVDELPVIRPNRYTLSWDDEE